MKHSYTYLVIAALIGLFVISCKSKDSSEDPISEKEKESVEVRPEVIFAVADDKPIYYYVESQGVAEANRQLTLKPKISGFVAKSNIVEGARFQKGQTILAFADDEWAYELQQAKDDYQKALNAYNIERNLRGDDKALHGTNGDSTRQDEMIRITTGLAKAQLALDRARLNLSYTTLKAPFSGQLAVPKRIEAGAYINAGTELGTLIDDRRMRVRFEVLEAEVAKVKKGMTAELTAPGGTRITGRVTAVSPMVDSESKTGEVIVEADNPGRLIKPGMTIEGRIQIKKITGKARVPRSAILSRDGGRTLLFKLHPQNDEVEWIYVTPVAQNNEWAIVDNPGVAPGDTIAVDKHFALSHLQVVTPKMESLQREETANPETGNR